MKHPHTYLIGISILSQTQTDIYAGHMWVRNSTVQHWQNKAHGFGASRSRCSGRGEIYLVSAGQHRFCRIRAGL